LRARGSFRRPINRLPRAPPFTPARRPFAHPQAYVIRLALRCRAHYLRIFTTLCVLTLGGGTLVQLFLGKPAPWARADRPAFITAVLLAYLIFFTRAGAPLYRLYRLRRLRDAWQAVAALQLALGAANGVDAALSAGLHAPAAALLGAVGALGGGLLAEAGDLLLQGHARYTAPISGPAPGAAVGVWAALAAAALRTAPAACAALAGLPPPPPLPHLAPALAMVAVAVILTVPGPPLAAGASRALTWALPVGFEPVWDGRRAAVEARGDAAEVAECAVVPPPWPLDAGLFGYGLTSLDAVEESVAAGPRKEKAA
jgi:hypothetical protein